MSVDPDDLESWLTEHPESNDDLVDLPHLRALYQSAWPTEPDEAAWNRAQARIHDSIAHGPFRRDRWPRRGWTIAGLVAASVLLGLLVTRAWWTPNVPPPVTTPLVEEPFPVAEADDVIIISMDAHDVAALVVGEPPVSGDLQFVRAEDIHVVHCARCPVSGKKARLEQEGEVPMFVTAAVAEPPNEDEE